jgi:hypothetical protein
MWEGAFDAAVEALVHAIRIDPAFGTARYREIVVLGAMDRIDRWGAAKPRSVTADRAKARARVLSCAQASSNR